MVNQNSKQLNPQNRISNFWFGFALGGAAVGVGLFLLGTKQGRTTLKKVIDLSENLEENISSLLTELEEGAVGKAEEIKDKILLKERPVLNNILHKMKDYSPEKKEVKKFTVR